MKISQLFQNLLQKLKLPFGQRSASFIKASGLLPFLFALFFFKEKEKKNFEKKLRKILTLRKIPTLRKISPISLDGRLARHSPFQVASTRA